MRLRSGASALRNVATTANAAKGIGSVARATPGALAANTAISAVSNAYELATDPQAYAAKMDAAVEQGFQNAIDGSNQFTNSLSGGLEGLSDPVGKIVEGGFALKALGDDLSNLANERARTEAMDQAAGESQGVSLAQELGLAEGTTTAISGLPAEMRNAIVEAANKQATISELKEKVDAGQGNEQAGAGPATNAQMLAAAERALVDANTKIEGMIKDQTTGFFGGEDTTKRVALQGQVQTAKSQQQALIEKRKQEEEQAQTAPAQEETSTPDIENSLRTAVESAEIQLPPLEIGELNNIAGIATSITDVGNVLTDIKGAFATFNNNFTNLQGAINTLSGGGFSIPLSIDATSVSALNKFNTDFNSYVTNLAQINIPDKITMSAKHTVTVNINGAEAFESMQSEFSEMIVTEIKAEFKRRGWNEGA